MEGDKNTQTHGSYLQGMETRLDYAVVVLPLSARILPTRNGNLCQYEKSSYYYEHGSYLQGMETSIALLP